MSPNDGEHELDFIDRLPAELLIHIFLDVLAPLDGADRFQFPFTLIQVSRRWQDVCLTTPHLWMFTWSRLGKNTNEHVALQLAHSSNLPLDLDIEWGGDAVGDEWCRVIAPLTGRLKSIKSIGPFTQPDLATLSYHLSDINTLPILQNAEFTIGTSDGLPFLSQHISCPRLKRLCVRCVQLFSPIPQPYTSLKVLVVSHCIFSAKYARSLFGGSPQIEECQFLRCWFDTAGDGGPSDPPIVAPCLRRLCVGTDSWIWQGPVLAAEDFLRALVAPELRELVYGFTVRVEGVAHTAGWQVRFPKLEVFGLWCAWVDNALLRQVLLVHCQSVQRFRFRYRNRKGKRHSLVTHTLSMLAELVENGALPCLEVIDVYGLKIWEVREGFRRRETRLPLRVRMHRSGVHGREGDGPDGVLAKAREFVEVEVYDDEDKEWIY